ncbi:NADPH:quinone reductase [Chitinophaga costaii]|uniref:NADPH:quinone reductase n=1 Tax=Chitinophaga costaii TaxID=1335309 RepID=A0A1C4AXW9_9BACT|nr:NADP-dependent oxidoreductase [Chitinophaga costaii]PUZ26794.1 NADP-dependent oxidoreductase [Chitinophaga costaii]SCB99421.1 NADPH:quinone reductase [Chitinophaga costaii]
MKAITVADFGMQPILSDMPKPTAGQGQLLVKLAAASVNPYDWKVIDGLLKGHVQHDFPFIPGSDGAGTIEALGECVSGHQVGDKIYGQFFTTPLGHGSYAEYVVVPQEGALDTVPQNISLEDAAALPTAAMTANALVVRTGLEDGPIVFIVGATGGVGSFAVQIAAGKGLQVIATASPAAAENIKQLGATVIIDHTQGNIVDQLKEKYPQGIDALIDMVSDKETFAALATQVKPGGYALTTVFVADEKALEKQGITGENFELQANANALQVITQLVESGALKLPPIQKVPLEKAPEALAQSRSGKTKGKLVITIGE